MLVKIKIMATWHRNNVASEGKNFSTRPDF